MALPVMTERMEHLDTQALLERTAKMALLVAPDLTDPLDPLEVLEKMD